MGTLFEENPMRNWTARPVGGSGGLSIRLLLVAVAAIGAGCASGGGGQAVMTPGGNRRATRGVCRQLGARRIGQFSAGVHSQA